MDFEKLYQKVKDGTATEEEKRLVEEEIRKAKEITHILDEKTEEKTEEASGDAGKADIFSMQINGKKLKEALHYFNFKHLIKTIIIVVISMITIAVLTVGGIFGVAIYNAGQNEKISQEQAVEIARNYVAEFAEIAVDKVRVAEVDKELDLRLKLTETRYAYEIEIVHPKGEYTVVVNAESGYAYMGDIDFGDRFDWDD